MVDDWMTEEHKAAALEGFLANPVAVAYAKQQAAADLVVWLREQIAEDRRVAEANAIDLWPGTTLQKVADDKTHYAWQQHDVSPQRIAHILRFGPRAVLAQCEAHTAILDLHVNESCPEADTPCDVCGEWDEDWPCDTLRATALAYQHNPGYREEWRP